MSQGIVAVAPDGQPQKRQPLRKPTNASGPTVSLVHHVPLTERTEFMTGSADKAFLMNFPESAEAFNQFKRMPTRRQYHYLRCLLDMCEEANNLKDPAMAAAAVYGERVEELRQQQQADNTPLCKMNNEARGKVGDLLINTAKLHGNLVASAMAIFAALLFMLLMIIGLRMGG